VYAVAKIERLLTFKQQRVTEEASMAVMNNDRYEVFPLVRV
jgi:hypothetical protein